MSVCAVSAAARLAPGLSSFSHITVNVTRFVLFKELQVIVARLASPQACIFLLLCARLIDAVDELYYCSVLIMCLRC
jgi:hypothetical protein